MSDSDQLEMNLPATGGSGTLAPVDSKADAVQNSNGPFNAASSAVQSSLSDDIKKALQFNERDIDAFPSLLERGMDINQTDDNNNTLLMLAAITGNLKVATLLISKGADIQRETGSFFTALRYAIANEHADVVRLLVDAGANLTEHGYEYSQKWAEDKGLTEIAQILHEAPSLRLCRTKEAEAAKENAAHEAVVAKQAALKELPRPHRLIIRPFQIK